MALVLADRVQETTTTTGTGTVTLAGAVSGYQSFAAVGNANTTYYTIAGQTTSEWEVGIGTYTSSGTTLSRNTILASSNAGSAVNFSAGTKNVFVTYPASRSVYVNGTTITPTNSGILPVANGGTNASTASITAFNNITGYTASGATGTTSTNLVFSTSPTLVTPALGTPSSGTLTNCTFPTLNQNTTGSAATLTTARAIYGNNFDGSAALTQIIASTYGGTGNGFTKFSGPATAEKTFTLPDATCSILTSNAAVTVAQGGTGVTTTPTNGQLLVGNGTNYTVATLGSGTGISTTTGAGTLTVNNTGVTSNVAGTGISVSGATGAVTITNSGVTSAVAGTGITVSGATGAVTVSIGQAVATSSNVQFNSLGVGTAGSATAGEIRATNNITAYYSDERLKTKVGNIENALDKVCQIETMMYHANEIAVSLGYDASILEVGVTAQSVQKVMPQTVAPAPIDDKYLTVRYERLVPLLIEAIKELEAKVKALENSKAGD
jgi:hypothetical protein